MRIYGTVNSEPVYSRDEFVFKVRGFGEITNDEELLAFAEKVTHGWYYAGWHQDFRTYYLGDYAESEPLRSMTYTEYARLRKLQEKVQKEYDEAEAAREWKHVNTVYYADNSVEEIWRDKNGVEKEVMIVPPHGDACF